MNTLPTITTKNNYIVGNVTWDPSYGTTMLSRQLPALFNDRWLSGLFDGLDKAFDIPGVHYPYNIKAVYNDKKELQEYQIEMALAGITKDKIKVQVKKGNLSIDIDKADEKEEANIQYIRRGISTRKAQVSFHLSDNVNIKKIASEYKDGILTVSVPVNTPEVTDIEVKVN